MAIDFSRLSGNKGRYEKLDDKPVAIPVGANRLTDHDRFMRILYNERYRAMLKEFDMEDNGDLDDPEFDALDDLVENPVTPYEGEEALQRIKKSLPSKKSSPAKQQGSNEPSTEPSGEVVNSVEVTPKG